MARLALALTLSCTSAQSVELRVDTGQSTEIECSVKAVRTSRSWIAPMTTPDPVPAPHRHRIALWGDSHTAAGPFVDAMLSAMGVDASQVMPTFLAASWNIKGVTQPLRASCIEPGWRTAFAFRGDRLTGAGLVSMTSDVPGSRIALDMRWPRSTVRVDSARVYLAKRHPDRTLILGVSADDGPESLIALAQDVSEPLLLRFSPPTATLRIRLVVGQVTVLGVRPDYTERAPVTVDVYSLPSATIEGWRHLDVSQKAFRLTRPQVDLAVLQYGTNDGPLASTRPIDYELQLRDGLQRFRRAFPDASCILVGPPDRGGHAATGPHSDVHARISRAQQRQAQDFGCDFWNWQAQMGGPGGAAARAARPSPTVQPDLIHLTPAGYQESGAAMGAWLSGKTPRRSGANEHASPKPVSRPSP